MRLLSLLILLLLPQSLWAACEGRDLRDTLSGPQRGEIAERLDGVPFAEGNHWRATKNDRQINVIGTMHIDDPRMDDLAGRLADVIAAADMLMVESTLEDQDRLQADIASKPDLAFLTGPTLIDLMPPQEWDALAKAAAARGVPSFMAAKFQPWYLSLILSMAPCTLQEVAAGAKGLDHRLMQMAQASNVPMTSLEPYTTVFSLFGQGSIDEQIDLLTLGILPVSFAEDATATLKEQYFAENHMASLETSRVVTRPMVDMPAVEFDRVFDDFMGLLIETRNLAWMDRIEDADAARLVVAAGALHLGGENGVLNLLAQRGYSLERMPF